mgnify:CR=1 FL=1
MFKLKRRSFLKFILLIGSALFFHSNNNLVNAKEEKFENTNLFTEANNWIVRINQKEKVLMGTNKTKKKTKSEKIKNKILNILK